MSGRGEMVEMIPNGGIRFERHEICSSAVLGRARKSKGEHLLPFATRANERGDARLYVEAMPQLPCKVTGFYVGGETFDVEPEIVLPGQYARLEIPEETAKRIGSLDLEVIACGVLASVETERSGMGRLQWKLPVGARIVREQVASTLTIAPNSTMVVQWQPEVASRFKRFAAEIVGDKNGLLLNDFRIGKDSFFLSSAPVPFAVATMPGTFEIPDIISPGILVTASLSNRSDEEVILGGGIVFENVEDELLALQKKYEESLEHAKTAAAQFVTNEVFNEGTK